MSKKAIRRLGGLLILAAALTVGVLGSYFTARHLTTQTVEFARPLRAPDGRPGFALILNSWAWRWVSGGSATDWERALVSDRANTRLSAIVAHGFNKVPNGCSQRWELSEVHPLPDGGMFVSGICTAGAGFKKAHSSSLTGEL
jgi:hypothetical protein